MSALRLLGTATLAALFAGGCGDPGYAVWLRNDSDTSVIVQFLSSGGGTGFPVAAHSIAGGPSGIGPTRWSLDVRVVSSEGCKLLWEQDFDHAPSGLLEIGQSGGTRFLPGAQPMPSEIPVPAVDETKKCLADNFEFFPMNG